MRFGAEVSQLEVGDGQVWIVIKLSNFGIVGIDRNVAHAACLTQG